MKVTVNANSYDWNLISEHWCSTDFDCLYYNLYNMKEDAEVAVSIVQSSNDIGSLSFNVTKQEIERLSELQKKIKNFSLNLYDTLDEMVDTPFYNQVLGFLKAVYLLNPKDITLDSMEYNGTKSDKVYSLEDVIGSLLVDEKLRKDFNERNESLNIDKPSKALKKALKGKWEWRDDISYEDMKEIDRILYEGIEEVDDWNARHAAGDPSCPYAISDVGELYYDMAPYWVFKDVASDKAKYMSGTSGVYINMEEQKTNPRNPYTTVFHEFGHMLDNSIVEVLKGKKVSSSTSVYLSSDYSKYSTEFYNNLINDANSYISKMKTTYDKTKYKSVEEAISAELTGAKMSEFSDLYCAVTHHSICGGYHHGDKNKSFWLFKWTDDYWDYDDKDMPSKGTLNSEAFAHFTEISIMMAPEDVKVLHKYFPTAYATYVKMIDDID